MWASVPCMICRPTPPTSRSIMAAYLQPNSDVKSTVVVHVDLIFGQFELDVHLYELLFELLDRPLQFDVVVVFLGLNLEEVIRLVQNQEEALPSASGVGNPEVEFGLLELVELDHMPTTDTH
jgi:hypothetical protein